jgi:predicted nucleic acid-binding protein
MMSEKKVFVDTGAWLALVDESDQYHDKAAAQAKKLHDGKHDFITTNLVIHETFMLLVGGFQECLPSHSLTKFTTPITS